MENRFNLGKPWEISFGHMVESHREMMDSYVGRCFFGNG